MHAWRGPAQAIFLVAPATTKELNQVPWTLCKGRLRSAQGSIALIEPPVTRGCAASRRPDDRSWECRFSPCERLITIEGQLIKLLKKTFQRASFCKTAHHL